MKLVLSIAIAALLFGLITGLQACEIGPELSGLTRPLTCGGKLVTERFTHGERGETVTSLLHFCETAHGEREEITGRVVAVELLYIWALSSLVVMVWSRRGRRSSGTPTAAPPGNDR